MALVRLENPGAGVAHRPLQWSAAPGAASRNKTPWPDPSPTCTLRHTNDNGCKPINHQTPNGWEHGGCSGTTAASVQESILKCKKKSWLNAPLCILVDRWRHIEICCGPFYLATQWPNNADEHWVNGLKVCAVFCLVLITLLAVAPVWEALGMSYTCSL